MEEKICYLILTTEKNSNRKSYAKSTWLEGKEYFFLSDKQNLQDRTWQMSLRDDYTSAAEKFINGINHISSNREEYQRFDWFFFCDDDTFVFERNLRQLMSSLDKKSFNGKLLSKKTDPHNPIFDTYNFEYLSGGAGMIVNKELIFNLPKMEVLDHRWSDVSLGLCLQKHRVTVQDVAGFNSTNHRELCHTIDETKKQVTYHYVKSREDFEHLQGNQ